MYEINIAVINFLGDKFPIRRVKRLLTFKNSTIILRPSTNNPCPFSNFWTPCRDADLFKLKLMFQPRSYFIQSNSVDREKMSLILGSVVHLGNLEMYFVSNHYLEYCTLNLHQNDIGGVLSTGDYVPMALEPHRWCTEYW